MKTNKNWPVSRITRLGLGIALFVVLTMCLQVPVFENYYLCLGYVVMAVYLYSIGTLEGTIIGVAGVILYCVLTSGLRGMPGWALGNLVIGVLLGGWLACCRWDRQKFPMHGRHPSRQLFYAVSTFIVILVSCCLGIGLVKSGVESILYGQPIWARMIKNSYALVADVVMLLLAYPICLLLDKHIQVKFNHTPKHLAPLGKKVRRRFIGWEGYQLKHGRVYTLYVQAENGKVRVSIPFSLLRWKQIDVVYDDHGAFAADWERVGTV